MEAERAGFDPVEGGQVLRRSSFGCSRTSTDDWLRYEQPLKRWVPQEPYQGRPYNDVRNRRHDRHAQAAHRLGRLQASTTRQFSDTLDDDAFPRGGNWLMVGPTGPRRLRLAIEHLANHRGCVLHVHRPRSALGEEADRVAASTTQAQGVHEPRRGPGDDDHASTGKVDRAVHHAEAAGGARRARSAFPKAGIRGVVLSAARR